MSVLLQWVTRRPGWVLLAVALLTLWSVSQLVDLSTGTPKLELDPSVNAMLAEDDENRRFYDHVRQVFGSDDTLVVALYDAEGVFRAEDLRAIKRMTERVEQVEAVHHVVSLANALDIRSSADGLDLEIEPFLDELPHDAAGYEQLKREVLDNPIYAGNLVSFDGRATALLVYLMDIPEAEFTIQEIDLQILRIAQQEAGDAQAWITGVPHMKAETSRALVRDLTFIVPVAFAVLGLIAFVSFRTLRAVVVPLATILLAMVWTLGTISALGYSLNLVTIVVPPLILVVGFAYAIHIVSAYYDALGAGHSSSEEANGAVSKALQSVTLPTLLTGATTAAGFLSLMTSPLGAVKEFGAFSTLGVLASMVASLSFAPALLQLLPSPRRHRVATAGGRIDHWLETLARFNLRNRRAILFCGALVAVVSLFGMSRIEVNTDLLGNFSPDSRVRRQFEQINEHLEGSGSFYVILETDIRDAFKEPVNLARVRELQLWLAELPGVGGSTSLVDYLMLINRGFRGGESAGLSIPETKRMVTQLLFFGANDEIENFVDSTYQTVSIRVRSRELETARISATAARIERRLAQLPEHIRGRVTGNGVLVASTIDDIAYGQAISLSTAFVIIFAILALLFASFRVGLIALIPNALPVLAYFGLLGLSGVTLNAVTGLVACLVLGIAVDDTIHFLTHFNRSAKKLGSEAEGVVAALRHVGRPVTYTTIALALGFTVMTTSELADQRHFGALAAITLSLAWLIDMTFTPALAAKMRIVTLWEILSLDLGESPEKTIPLLHGLSRTQARIAALMTRIVSFPKGHRLFRVGDRGDEMYVIIDGALRASVPSEHGELELRTMRRGDAVGEVGLFHGTRSADVEALTDVRLIRLSRRGLERLQSRSPRISAVLYRNLGQILADRLASATERATN